MTSDPRIRVGYDLHKPVYVQNKRGRELIAVQVSSECDCHIRARRARNDGEKSVIVHSGTLGVRAHDVKARRVAVGGVGEG